MSVEELAIPALIYMVFLGPIAIGLARRSGWEAGLSANPYGGKATYILAVLLFLFTIPCTVVLTRAAASL